MEHGHPCPVLCQDQHPLSIFQSSSLKFVFHDFFCIQFLPHINFLSSLSYAFGIYHFYSAFRVLGVCGVPPPTVVEVSWLKVMLSFIIFILFLSWLSSSRFFYLPLLLSTLLSDFYVSINICIIKEIMQCVLWWLGCLTWLLLKKITVLTVSIRISSYYFKCCQTDFL